MGPQRDHGADAGRLLADRGRLLPAPTLNTSANVPHLMRMHTEDLNTQVKFESLKAQFTVRRPETIREKVAAWAFENVKNIEAVIACLERIDCAGCYSPAPIYNHAMAREVNWYRLEIDEARDAYQDATGKQWTPSDHGGLLSYLWCAYKWIAHELASEIRHTIEE